VGDTYLVESGGDRYILRVYRSSHRNRVQIGAEVDLLLALQRAEVSVSSLFGSDGNIFNPLRRWKLAQLDVSAFSTGYCHFDFLPKNFHFDGDSVTFFDFDFMATAGWSTIS